MRLGSSAYAEVLTAELLGVTGWGAGWKKEQNRWFYNGESCENG